MKKQTKRSRTSAADKTKQTTFQEDSSGAARLRQAQNALLERAAGRYDHADPESLDGFADSALLAHRPGVDDQLVDRSRYRGVRVRRSEVFGDGSDDSSFDDDDDEEEDSSEEATAQRLSRKRSGVESSESDDDNDEDDGRSFARYSDSDDGDSDFDSDDYRPISSSSSSDDDDDDDDRDSDEKDTEQDQKALVQSLTDRSQKDMEKAQHTSNQKKIWDSLFSLRIKMQPLLVAANRLPSGVSWPAKVSSELDGLCGQLQQTLDSLLFVQQQLASHWPELESMALDHHDDEKEQPTDKVDRALARYWSKIERRQKLLDGFFVSVVDAWSAKASLSSMKIAQTKFKALNQSIAVQLEQTMRNYDRLLERTRTKRTPGRILGTAADDADAAAGRQPNPDLFDDSDFYQHMLRELLEASKSADDPMEAGRQWVRIKDQVAKDRKNVDRRASKGRVLRYHTQEPLVNFMAPVELTAPPYTDRLFIQLFGKHDTSSQN